MSARSPIPKKIREQLENDAFMSVCINENWECGGRIEWHHSFSSAGRRVNEIWAILPLCTLHHKKMTRHTQALCRMNLRARIRHFKAMDDFKTKYPRSDLFKDEKLLQSIKVLI